MLNIEHATKTFQIGTPNEQKALDDLSLLLQTSEFVTIIGTNGAGKSTLFNAICGGFYLDEGRILLDEKDITFMAEHKRALQIGRVFQDPMKGTAPDMTVKENLAIAYASEERGGAKIGEEGKQKEPSVISLGLKSAISSLKKGVNKKDVEFFKEQLSTFGMGLEDRMDTKMGLLSGGQRQAVSLLMCTMTNPKLLLLDEHTAALDPAAAEKVMEITRKVVREKKLTTLMITHNINQALSTGSRTVMMNKGQIVLDIKGKERDEMTIPALLELYANKAKSELETDTILFS